MEYRNLGRSGLKVSPLCLGTMTFGRTVNQASARELVDLALDAGVNFVDTADAYSNGRSEEILGQVLQTRRPNIVLATKFFNPTGPSPNDSGMSRVHIMNAVDESLQRLQTDWIDIYYIHHVDVETPMEEMLRALDDLVTSGKVRYIGCSNYQAWRLATALGISDQHDWARFVCYQPQYSLVVRDIEQELVPLCLHHGLGIVVWSPLAGGFLTGKYEPGQRQVEGSRSEAGWAFPQRFFAPNADESLAALLEVSQELERPPSQVALRWALAQPGITSTIVGASKLEQLRENLGAATWQLEGEPLERLNQVSHLPDRYPEAFEKNMRDRREKAVDMPAMGK